VTADDTLDLTGAGRSMRAKVTVSRNGAQLSGRVLDANGDAVSSPVVMILLMKGETDLPNSNEGMIRITPDAKYSTKGVRPGKYRVVVVDAFQMGNRGDEAIKTLYKRSEEIELKEGDRINKDVKVLPKEDANAKQ
jgi:hypothetical protein